MQILAIQDEIQIAITDNGVGIEEKDVPFIFDRLYKCDTSRTENSNGLGLAIAKELITALDGTIVVDSCYFSCLIQMIYESEYAKRKYDYKIYHNQTPKQKRYPIP